MECVPDQLEPWLCTFRDNHFDEDKRVVVAADDVNLTSAVSAEIAIKNLVTVLAQETAGQLFTERTAPKVFRPE